MSDADTNNNEKLPDAINIYNDEEPDEKEISGNQYIITDQSVAVGKYSFVD